MSVLNFCPLHLSYSFVTNVLRGYTYEYQESRLVLMLLGLIFNVLLFDSDATPVTHQRPSRAYIKVVASWVHLPTGHLNFWSGAPISIMVGSVTHRSQCYVEI